MIQTQKRTYMYKVEMSALRRTGGNINTHQAPLAEQVYTQNNLLTKIVVNYMYQLLYPLIFQSYQRLIHTTHSHSKGR